MAPSTDPDLRIRRRLLRVEVALEKALADMKVVFRRIERLQARAVRLRAALAMPAERRQARARRAVATRQAVQPHRQRVIRVDDDE